MRWSWRASWLLPIALAVAEGGWLTVVYAALAVVGRDVPAIGPFELALLAGAGLGWSRRGRWRSRLAGGIGLMLLVAVGGAIGWLLAPEPRSLLIAGEPAAAIRTHLAGWIAAAAVLRGAGYADPSNDEERADLLLRWVLPLLVVPWLAGGLVGGLLGPALLRPFTAAAFIGTVAFTVSAFVALGVARLETVRRSSGSDWRQNRSWLLLVLAVAAVLVAVAVPAGALLGVPLATLVSAVVAPLRLLFVVLLVAATPLILLAGLLSEQLRTFFPNGIDLSFLGDLLNRTIGGGPDDPPELPTLLFFGIVGILLLLELAFLGVVTWMRWQERRRMRALDVDGFEERAIVLPDDAEAARHHPVGRRRRPGRRGDDPVRAYLDALDLLAHDGRWARDAAETPLRHAARLRPDGPPMGRLAAGFALVRYAGRQPTARDAARSRLRLAAVHRAIRRRRAPPLP